MDNSSNEYRNRIHSHITELVEDPKWELKKKYTNNNSSFDRIYIIAKKTLFTKLLHMEYIIGIMDDRRPSPESLEKAQIELGKEASKHHVASRSLVTIAFADKLDGDARNYIETHKKSKKGARYLFVIDSSAKSVVYDDYPYPRSKHSQKSIRKLLIDPVLN